MYDLSEIKSRLTCVEYARSQGLPIHKSGDRCASPFHAGKNPTSLVVHDDFWYSHSDAVGGDVIDFCAMLRHDGNRGAAIRELATLTGATEPANATAWRNYTQNLGNAVAAWHQKLTDDDRDYLHSRGITDETINKLMLGRCTAPGHRGRLVIPYWKNGYVAYYTTRARPGCQSADAKYKKQTIDDLNEHVVWGMDTLSRPGDTLVIAEGAFDALSFYQSNYPTISAMTGMFSAQQLPTVLAAARSFQNVFMVYDNDPTTHAGTKFTIRTARILARNRIPFTVGIVPRYHDVSEYYAAGGNLSELVASGTHGLEYLLQHDPDISELSDTTPYSGAICEYLNAGSCDAITSLILRLRASTTEIEAFMYSIARYTRRERLAYLFDQLSRHGEFSERWLKELLKSVSQAPSERVVADAIREKHQLIYNLNDSFYEYTGGCWRAIDELAVRRYIIEYLGVFATDQRARAAAGLLKSLCLTEVTFNATPVWNFCNGTLELDTGTFREPNPLDYCSVQMPYPYKPDAQCPEWRQFIHDVSAGDEKMMELLQFIAGYVLFQDCVYQKMFYLVGAGGNGKSEYVNTLLKLFGAENTSFLQPRDVLESFKLVTLNGKLLNISYESPGGLVGTEETLKKLSAGENVLACHKGKPFFSFTPRAKLVLLSNEPPTFNDVSDAIPRRMIVLNFPVKFVENPDPSDIYQRQIRTDISDYLMRELTTGGIFNWCYEGYRVLKQVGYFTETDAQDEMMQDFRETSSPVLMFYRDFVEPTMPDELGTRELYADYRQWCFDNGEKPLSNAKFHVEFKKVVGRKYVREDRSVRRPDGQPRKFRFYVRVSRISTTTEFRYCFTNGLLEKPRQQAIFY